VSGQSDEGQEHAAQTRVCAAQELLNRGHGKPPQAVTGEGLSTLGAGGMAKESIARDTKIGRESRRMSPPLSRIGDLSARPGVRGAGPSIGLKIMPFGNSLLRDSPCTFRDK
jgi:hypothetical protein